MSDVTARLSLPLESTSLVRQSTYNALAEALDGLIGGTQSRALKDLYIDPVGGDDLAADGTAARPFKTWNALKNSGLLPKVISQSTTVWIRPGTLSESVDFSNYMLLQPLSLKPWLTPQEIAFIPAPFGGVGFVDYFIEPAWVVGPKIGQLTGGTKYRAEMAGAGWVPGELRGLFWMIYDGPHFFSWGRIEDNGADWFEVSGLLSSNFSASDKFFFGTEAVTIKPPATSTRFPSTITYNMGSSRINFYGIKIAIGDNRYGNYGVYMSDNQCAVRFDFCSFIGNSVPTYAGATSQFLLYNYRCSGEILVYACDLYFPALKAGTTTGAFWAIGPHGMVRLMNSTIISNVQTWDGCTYFALQNCSLKYPTGMLEYNYVRAVNYYVIQSTRMNWNNVAWGYRLDGKVHFDIRNCLFENALGYGFKSYDGHGDIFDGWIEYTEVNACSISGFDIGGNSYFGIRVLTTDPAKKNGKWGFRLRSGTQVGYLGTNTLTGNLGDVNLGDDVTAVAWGVPTTDTTHLTRVAAQGA